MTDATLLPFDLPAVQRQKLTVDFDGGNQSSDAGLLLLRTAECKLGVCQRIADAMPDHRDPSRVRHEMFELVASCVFAISCGYKDGNDLNRLRHDLLMKLAIERLPEKWKAACLAIDDISPGVCAKEDGGGAVERRSYRPILRQREAEEKGDP